MNRKTVLLFLLIVTSLLVFSLRCSRREKTTHFSYHKLSREFLSLYAEANPIAASNLGVRSADSELFTFEEDEIDSLLYKAKNLKDEIGDLKPLNYNEYEKDNILLILYWLNGEIFALKDLQNYKYSPMIYTFAIEQALFSLPERVNKAYAGEFEAYLSRISKIHKLTASAKRNLVRPATIELESAIEAIDRLLGQREYLKEKIAERYAQCPEDTISSIFKSIEELKADFQERLSRETKNRNILGLEELSKIILYDEFMSVDPNSLIKDAERMIRTLRVRRNSLVKKLELEREAEKGRAASSTAVVKEKSMKPGKDEEGILSLARSIVSRNAEGARRAENVLRLYEAISGAISKRTFATKKVSKRVEATEANPRSCSLAKSYPLSLPAPQRTKVFATASTILTGGLPSLTLYYNSNASYRNAEELIYSLISCTPDIMLPGLTLMRKADTIRTLLHSETFEYSWYFVKMKRLIEKLPSMKDELLVILADEKIRALSRMIVSIELNSGATTLDRAKEKFAELTGSDTEEAEREAVAASITPSYIYPGASIVITDKIYRILSSRIDVKDPRKELEETLLRYNELPVMLIFERVKE